MEAPNNSRRLQLWKLKYQFAGVEEKLLLDLYPEVTLAALEARATRLVNNFLIKSITALRRVEARGAIETVHRTLQIYGQVFRYGIAKDALNIMYLMM